MPVCVWSHGMGGVGLADATCVRPRITRATTRNYAFIFFRMRPPSATPCAYMQSVRLPYAHGGCPPCGLAHEPTARCRATAIGPRSASLYFASVSRRIPPR